MNQKIKEIIILACVGVIIAGLYFIYNLKQELIVSNQDNNILIDKLHIDIEGLESEKGIYLMFIDSMSIVIDEKPKYRTIYINNHKGENEKIANLDSLTRAEYLDSIFAKRSR